MKLEEMFYGAWIKKSGSSRPGILYAGDLKNIFMDIENFGSSREKEIEEIYKPVPISSEILKKSGFNEWGSYFWDDKAEVRITKFCADDDNWICEYGRNKLTLRYVHELQFFLMICGVEMEILV